MFRVPVSIFSLTMTLPREAELPALPPGHWHLSIEDPQASWRIAGTWSGAMQPFVLDTRAH